jgi:hypothetical protein
MKKTELEKLKGAKLGDRIGRAVTPGRFGKDAGALPSRREQRKLDQAKGLIPFAVKIESELAKQIQDLAQQRKADLNEVVAELLKKGLAG